jgi:hypothetical protein
MIQVSESEYEAYQNLEREVRELISDVTVVTEAKTGFEFGPIREALQQIHQLRKQRLDKK